MNELQVFKNSEFGELSVFQIDGKEYFPATACAKALEYKEPKSAIRLHCRWGVKHTLPHPQNPNKEITMNFIPIGDLIRLITHSKMEKAQQYESWVFDEVLPSIHKTGSYGAPNMQDIITQTAISVSAEIMKQMMPLFNELLNKSMNNNSIVKETATYNIKSTQRRRPTRSIISALDPTIRNEVEKMLIMSDKFTYSDIVNFLSECGVSVSIASVARYSQTLNC